MSWYNQRVHRPYHIHNVSHILTVCIQDKIYNYIPFKIKKFSIFMKYDKWYLWTTKKLLIQRQSFYVNIFICTGIHHNLFQAKHMWELPLTGRKMMFFFYTIQLFFFYFLHKLNKAVVSQSLSICMTGVLHSIMCQLCTKWITYSHGSITVSWYISLTSLLKLLDFTTMKSFTTFSQLWSLFASMISLPLKNKREIQCHLSLFFKRVILLTK